jgi:hypothetical protein
VIRELAFEAIASGRDGRSVRTARFERRLALPLSVPLLAANELRERLSRVLGAPVETRVLAACVPDARSWEAIAADARWWRIEGSAGEAMLILRPDDALALARAAFGEEGTGAMPLSALETAALDRVIAVCAPAFAALCGAERPLAAQPVRAGGWPEVYFEIAVEGAVTARMGIGVADAAPAPPHSCAGTDALGGVGLRLDAVLSLERLGVGEVLRLRPGDLLCARSGTAEVRAAGRTIARGEYGVHRGCGAVRITEAASGDSANVQRRSEER